jgi:shikimate dehydrogenase
MPGAGKTTAGRYIAEKTGMEFVDLDEVVSKGAGMPIAKIFECLGEKAFRDMESQAAKEHGKRHSLVIASGGGVVLREENMDALAQNAITLFLKRELKDLERNDRPLSKDMESLEKMYEERLPLYEKYKDFTVSSQSLLKYR